MAEVQESRSGLVGKVPRYRSPARVQEGSRLILRWGRILEKDRLGRIWGRLAQLVY